MRPLTSPSGNALGYGQRPMGSALERSCAHPRPERDRASVRSALWLSSNRSGHSAASSPLSHPPNPRCLLRALSALDCASPLRGPRQRPKLTSQRQLQHSRLPRKGARARVRPSSSFRREEWSQPTATEPRLASLCAPANGPSPYPGKTLAA